MSNETFTQIDLDMAQEAFNAYAKQLRQFADRAEQDLCGKLRRSYAACLRKEATAFESLSAKAERMFWADEKGGAA